MREQYILVRMWKYVCEKEREVKGQRFIILVGIYSKRFKDFR